MLNLLKGVFPNEFKILRIFPIQKLGQKTNKKTRAYRPISVTPHPCHILIILIVVAGQLSAFLREKSFQN